MYSKVLLAFCQQKFCRIQKKRLTKPTGVLYDTHIQSKGAFGIPEVPFLYSKQPAFSFLKASCSIAWGFPFLAIKKVTGTVTFYQAHMRSFLIFSFSSSFSIPCSCKFENSVCTEPSYQNLRKSSVCCLRKLSRSIS